MGMFGPAATRVSGACRFALLFLAIAAGACADASDDGFDSDRDASGGAAGAVAVARSPLTIDSASVAPIAAYSTALQLRAAYTGSAFRVRRASDNVELDVGFTGNRVSTSALVSFCGSSDCFLVTLYDQSGSAQDLAQNTVANEIKMYDGAARALVGGNSYPLISVNSPGKSVVRGGTLGLSGNPAFTIAYQGRYYAGSNRNEITTINICGVAGPVNNSIGLGFGEPVSGPWLLSGGGNIGWANTGSESRTHRGVLRHAAGAPMSASTFRFNGVDLGASSSGQNGSLPFDITPSFTLLGKSPSNNNDSGSELSSVLIWNTVLGNADLALVEQLLDPALASCGDGIVNSNEECDDGNLADGDACSSTCTLPPANPNAALLDTVTAPVGAYSVALKLRAAYSGAALRVRRASDNAQQDIGFATGNKVDGAAVAAFCAASDCFVTKLYDQSISGRDLVQNTPASQYRIYVGATHSVTQMDGQPVLGTEGAARWLVSNTTGNGLSAAGAMTMAYRGRVAAAPAVLAQTYHLDGWVTGLVFQAATPAQMVTSYDSGAVGAPAGAVTSTHTGVLYKDANATVGSTVMRVNGAQLAINQTSNPTTVPRLGDQTLVLGNDGTRGANGATEISTFLLWDRVLTAREVTIVEGGLGGSPAGQCAAGAACSEQCPCEAGKICSSDLGCRRNLTCRADVAPRFGLPAGSSVCWDPSCDSIGSPLFECGSASALCGACPQCTPQCASLDCGSDSCWGTCGDFCLLGELGCDAHDDCQSGECALNENQENACVLDKCEHPGLNPCSQPGNAGRDTECGHCEACTPDCTNRNCGPAPNGCGSCDSLSIDPATQYCSGEGQVRNRVLYLKLNQDLRTAAAVAGAIPGVLSVDDAGQAAYTMPLQVPPGRNGIEPQLALTYSSAGGNGYTGMGFNLSGLSAIARCPKTIAQDGAAAPVTFTNSDRFCLDGNRLVLAAGGTYGADGTVYHTELDGFSRVVSIGNVSGEPREFELRTHDGRILTFDFRVPGGRPLVDGSYDPNSEDSDTSTVRTQSWLLTQVRDRFGNAMRITYGVIGDKTLLGSVRAPVQKFFRSVFGGPVLEYYPVAIDYGLNVDDNGNVRIQSDRSVRFQYRDRRDVLTGYFAGERYERTKLLEHITASAQGSTIFRYDLAYDEPAAGPDGLAASDQLHVRSRLRTVQQCARAGIESATGESCKKPTVFEYQDVDPRIGSVTTGGPKFPSPPDVDADFAGAPITLDLDGNGQDDVVFSMCTHSTVGVCDKLSWALVLNGQEVNLDLASTAREIVDPHYGRPLVPLSAFVLDYDFDGDDDILEIDTTYRIGRTRKWSLVGGQLVAQDIPLDLGVPTMAGSINLIDADGDGAQDVLVCTPKTTESWTQTRSVTKYLSTTWTLLRRDPSGNFMPAVQLPRAAELDLPEVASGCAGGVPVDVDGDGKQELLLNVSTIAKSQFISWARDYGYTPNRKASSILWPLTGKLEPTAIPASNQLDMRLVLDINGDGLADVFELSDDFTVRSWLNTGRGFVSHQQKLSLSSFGSPYSGGDFARQVGRFATTFDVNLDGRVDLIVPVSDGAWGVLRSRGRDFAVESLGTDIQPKLGGRFIVYDANHDGLRDLAVVPGSPGPLPVHINMQLTSAAPRLRAVTDGLGARSELEWDARAYDGGGVYTRSNAGCGYPAYCPGRPDFAVVKRMKVWDKPLAQSADPVRTFDYSYSGFARDLLGRGSLGFDTRRILDSARSFPNAPSFQQTTIAYQNKLRDSTTGMYPLAGLPRSITDESMTTLNRWRIVGTSNLWTGSEGVLMRPTPRSIFMALRGSTTTTVETDVNRNNVQLLGSRSSVYDYDDFGNSAHAVTRSYTGNTLNSTVTVDSEYVIDAEHDGQRWLPGLLRLRTTSGTGEAPAQRTERYVYAEDSDGSGTLPWMGVPEETVREPFKPQDKLATHYAFNTYGNVESETETGNTIDGSKTRTVLVHYDAAQMFPDSVTINPGAIAHVITVGYDQGLGVEVYRSEAGKPNAAAVVTRTIPDGFGRARLIVHPDGTTTNVSYAVPASGAAMSVRAQRTGQPSQTTFYDVLGRESRRESDGFSSTLVQETRYNALGLPAEVTRPYTAAAPDTDVTKLFYDAQSRLVQTKLPNGRTIDECYQDNVSCVHNRRGYTKCDVHNGSGQVLYAVQAKEDKTKSCAAVASEVAAAYPSDGTTPARNGYLASSYGYDAFGALIRTQDSAGNAVTYKRDGYGRALEQNDPDAGKWTHTYNAFGEVETEVDAGPQTAVFRYDLLGRMISRTDLATATSIQQVTSFDFDSTFFGRPSATSSPDGVTTSFTYFPSGLLATFSRTIPSAPINGVAQPAQTLLRSQQYDASARLSTVSYSANGGASMGLLYHYNALNHLDKVSRATGTALDYWTALSTDAYGQLASERFGNQAVTGRTYQVDTGLLDVLSTTRSSSTLQSWKHSYNENDELSIRKNQLSGNGTETRFDYDAMDRVLSSTLYPSSSTTAVARYRELYTYDPTGTGNIASKQVSGTSVTTPTSWTYNYVDGTGRPHAVKSLSSGTTVQQYTYASAGGELATRSAASGMPGAIGLSYNRRHLPARFTSPGSSGAVDLQYDAARERVHKVATGAETFYLDDAFSHMRVPGTSGFVDRIVVQIAGRPVAEDVRAQSGSQTVSYLHTDARGSVELVTNSSGSVIEQREYEAFGRRRQVTGSGPSFGTRYDFADQERDSDFNLGLINMRARLYDPAIGRFLAPDPISAQPLDSQGLNPYSYVENRPTSRVDPLGLYSYKWPEDDGPYQGSQSDGPVDGGVATGGAAVGVACTAASGGTCAVAVAAVVIGVAIAAAVIGNLEPSPPDTDAPKTFSGAAPASNVESPDDDHLYDGLPFTWSVPPPPEVTQGEEPCFFCTYRRESDGRFVAAPWLRGEGSTFEEKVDYLGHELLNAVMAVTALPTGGGEAAAEATTTLFRAVSPAELADIEATGQLINRGSAEGKYFSTSAEAVSAYARQAVKGFGDEPYTLISTEIPSSAITPEMRAVVDRGVPAVVVPDAMLETLTPTIWNFMPIP